MFKICGSFLSLVRCWVNASTRVHNPNKNETPRKKEVQTTSFWGISFCIDQDIYKVHRTSRKEPASHPPPADPRVCQDSMWGANTPTPGCRANFLTPRRERIGSRLNSRKRRPSGQSLKNGREPNLNTLWETLFIEGGRILNPEAGVLLCNCEHVGL